ncbi:MAG: transketolase a tkta [Candidatus Magasanikbacteria bacterium GW2011_GWC2_37_14]|uniref:Transketolase a tkta n=1 Tax=Candidatus Magasanikbacteria bacterium GW2011_GWC2_37_14 TaxID=1619046 RepID=A0A0G0IUA9_9BACT|nr:MAG: transketolase a tkta [Candidatus Magasanikbacteria bacterium GW2011_GWC2_37_14]
MSYNFKGGEYLNLQGQTLASLPGIDLEKLTEIARIMRGFIFTTVEAARSGHPGGPSAKVEQFLGMVLGGAMAFDALDPKNTGRDRVIWSAGHCSPGLYAGLAVIYEALRKAGINFDGKKLQAVLPEDLARFRHPDGPQGHIENHNPLTDFGTGPSGHGLSVAGGMAAVHKSCGLKTKFWVFMGDAESEEGMSYEARNLINVIGLDNVIVSLDYNHYGIDGDINEVISSPYINHWLGMGWNVIEIDGHNLLECIYAYKKAAEGFANGSPTVVIAHTIKGKYYGAKENTADSHGSPAKFDEYVAIMKNLGFEVPGVEKEILKDIAVVQNALTPELGSYIAERLVVTKNNLKSEEENIGIMKTTLAGRELVNPTSIKCPVELPAEFVYEPGTKVATRKATQAWFEWLMKQTAFFYAGTGDLSKSILTDKAEKVFGIMSRTNPLGRGVRFGIAEQNMAMWSAGLTVDRLPGGFAPVSIFSSYAVFTSMMTNCVRLTLINNHLDPTHKGFFIMLAAHDGPETGEDGPTHQGMYWMSIFTAYPGIKVYKPLDANETIAMLFYALEKGEPIVLSVSRPDTLVLDRSVGSSKPADANNGAYVFYETKESKENSKKIVLAVSGSIPMANTMKIVPDLEAQGLSVKVLAVTSPQLFEELRKNNPAKAQEIFADEERAITIPIHNGWKGFLYPFILPADYQERGISIDTYLKSGTSDEVYALAGMMSEDIKNKILNIIK